MHIAAHNEVHHEPLDARLPEGFGGSTIGLSRIEGSAGLATVAAKGAITRMPRFARSRYTPRRPAAKSYSGVMSGSASRALFIASSFSRCGRPCGDDPNAAASVRVDDNKEPGGARRTNRGISNLISRVVLVMDGDGERVEEDGRGVLEAQAALGRDASRLSSSQSTSNSTGTPYRPRLTCWSSWPPFDNHATQGRISS